VAATQSLSVDHLVAVLVAAAHGRLHAAVGQEAAEDDRRDSLAAQDEIQIRARECVEPAEELDLAAVARTPLRLAVRAAELPWLPQKMAG
jgi:hypothetical protein